MASNDSTVLFNGKIYQTPASGSGDDVPTFASCMVIKNGLIDHIGTEDDAIVVEAKSNGAKTQDLGGQTVLPGFVDGHIHLLMLGQSLAKVKLDACKTLEDIRNEIKAYAASHPEVPRIFGNGWMHSMTPEGVDASLLDDLDPRPIFIDSKDLHSTWANKAGVAEVFRVMGISNETPDPTGGSFQRDAEGNINGLFSESAVFETIWPFVARVASIDERKQSIEAAFAAFNAVGYTGLIDMAMDETIWEPLIALRKDKGTLDNMRVAAYWLMKPNDDIQKVLAQVDQAAALAREYNAEATPDCRVVGVKVICDGIIDSCTASLTEPYSTGANPDGIWTEEVLDQLVAKAHAAGLQVALHAIGDRTVKMAIDVLERNTDRSRRPRIEHLELTSPEDARRLGQLGITASIQPVHADPAILRAWPRLIGPGRCSRAFVYREFVDGGAVLAIGSDAPTAPHEPLPNMYVATTRRSYREPSLETVINPENALTVCQAVAGATQGSAYSCFADAWAGQLKAGYKADFVVCRVDLVPEKLIGGYVLETWFEGKRVYKSEG
jgi:predicted amidohydrolase YtcJ